MLLISLNTYNSIIKYKTMSTIKKSDVVAVAIYESVQYFHKGVKPTIKSAGQSLAVVIGSGFLNSRAGDLLPIQAPMLGRSESILGAAVVAKSKLLDKKNLQDSVLNGLKAVVAARLATIVVENMGFEDHLL